MDENATDRVQLLESMEKINNRVLSFQNYAMRRVWGLLFGIIAILVLVGSVSNPLITYFINSAYLAGLLSLIVQNGVFLFAIFYWFRLFDNSLSIIKFREYTASGHFYNSRNGTINWRNAIIVLFLLGVFASLFVSGSNLSFRSDLSNLILLFVYLLLDLILIRGLKGTFGKIPLEGYAVFVSYMILTVFSYFLSVLGDYFVIPVVFIHVEYLVLGLVITVLLLCSFSFIYHAPDYLEELNEQ